MLASAATPPRTATGSTTDPSGSMPRAGSAPHALFLLRCKLRAYMLPETWAVLNRAGAGAGLGLEQSWGQAGSETGLSWEMTETVVAAGLG